MRIRSPLLVLLVTAWWTLNALVWSGQVLNMREATGQALDVAQVLRLELASAWLWIPITFGLFWCVRRWPIEWPGARGRIAKALFVHAMAVSLVIVARALAVFALNGWIGWYATLPSFGAVLATSTLNNLLMSWMIVGIAHALVYAERARHRERQAQRHDAQELRGGVRDLPRGPGRERLDAAVVDLAGRLSREAVPALAGRHGLPGVERRRVAELAAVAVLLLDDAGESAQATAMSVLIIGLGLATRLLFWGLLRGITRRTQAWTAPTQEPPRAA